MSGLSTTNPTTTAAGTTNSNNNNPANTEPAFDARNVNPGIFRIGGFKGEFPTTLDNTFITSSESTGSVSSAAEGDVDGPTPTTKEAGQQGQEGDEDEEGLSEDEKVRRQRRRQWAALVASGEITPDKLGVRPGQKYTLPVEKPKYY
ncbi:hypothetical protein FBU30_008565 [Linnemannia zychae]|nr:hypothetical protein FBU30_008565 [Linnemannia zychae]